MGIHVIMWNNIEGYGKTYITPKDMEDIHGYGIILKDMDDIECHGIVCNDIERNVWISKDIEGHIKDIEGHIRI